MKIVDTSAVLSSLYQIVCLFVFQVYHETVEPIIPAIFQRTKATCFAYGQTGKKLCMREDGKQKVCIVGLQEYIVSSLDTIKDLIEKGNATRSIGTTGANEESSRSHAILQLAIKKTADGNESKPARIVGKLSFIDLAGSERGADTTDNDKQTRFEVNSGDTGEDQKPGWPKQVEKEAFLSYNGVSSGREEDQVISSHANLFRANSRSSSTAEVFDYSEEVYEPDKPSWRKGKAEAYSAVPADGKTRRVDSPAKRRDSRNEDQPGNQLDEYVSRLNAILSQKAAGIVNLQTRLAHFQRHLTEKHVLVSSLRP
ncbi:hypothetical protein B296_00032178 [Ensete ventricosum]|uniref:Kinesin-like protein n=1 Tax=Ensete ventricosum TaxID=4639 RepID=A0A426ZXW2_ENSVE|nr:hypothetical protein B296_00032178 [Ensete ventricosum]